MRVLIFIVVVSVGITSLVWYSKTKIGDIRPAFFPAPISTDSMPSGALIAGSPVPFPLSVPSGYSVSLFARDVGPARDLAISAGGTIVVSVPKEGSVKLLPHGTPIITKLANPHGIAFWGTYLFVAEETRMLRYQWNEGKKEATFDKKLFDLPKGGRHTTRSVVVNKHGQMFVSVGSTCDTCVENHPFLAAVIVSDTEGAEPRVWATGLRNAPFIALHPTTDELWGTEMGRDFLGDNLPPDEINVIRDGTDYGWPYCYGNKVFDTTFGQAQATRCNETQGPIFEIPAHSAPLGLAFFEDDLLVSYHGSWNRSTPTGYKVVRIKKAGNEYQSEDFLTGFLSGSQAVGRPVDILVGKQNEIYVSDDKAGMVYVLVKK